MRNVMRNDPTPTLALLTLALAVALALALSVACGGGGGDRAGEPRQPRPEGTTGTADDISGKAEGTRLTGCLERNLQTGQFELVMQGESARRAGDPNAGMQPGHDRLTLVTEGSAELTQHVGRRVTVEGRLGAAQPVTDAGTRSYGVGEGADPSQTRSREGDSRLMTVRAVTNVGESCQAEKR